MSDYESRITRRVVLPKGEPLFCWRATSIEIDDEGAGEYLVISQYPNEGKQKIKIDPAEWPHIRDAIDLMITECLG